MNVVGIMSGTSVDGVDYVHCSINESGIVKFLDHASEKIPLKMRTHILAAAQNEKSTYELGELHFELGRLYSDQLKKIQMKRNWKIDLIGLHGQTIYHRGSYATWQMGSPFHLKNSFDKPIVYNFRENDVSLGGQGAPLAPLFHYQLLTGFHDSKKAVAFHNLGGISNTTWMKPGQQSSLTSFDTGPANILIDLYVSQLTKGLKTFDDSGKWAHKGVPNVELLRQMMKHPFLKKPFPKSCGREEFGKTFIDKHQNKLNELSPEDALATLTEFTAQSISEAYLSLPQIPETIYFSGGGINNKYLMSRIRYLMPHTVILTSESLGWPSQAIEGGAFAFLAWARISQKRFNLKKITGVENPQLLGVVI